MSNQNTTTYEVKHGAAWICLNRPESRNALSGELITELYDHLAASNEDDNVRCMVITGKGVAFCAGADLKNPPKPGEGGRIVKYEQLLKAILDSPKPIISAVNGAAFAGGLGLVGASDIAITVDNIQFSFSEVRIGVIPAIISVVCIPKLGLSNARKLFLTGERFSANQAVAMGLAHRAVSPDQLMQVVQEEIDAIRLGSPHAIREAKKLVRRVVELPVDEAFTMAAQWSEEMFRSDEAAEGVAAFREKRKARWAV